MNKYFALILMALLPLFAGCATQADCSDEDVLDVLRTGIIQVMITKEAKLQGPSMTFGNISTLKANKKLGNYACRARVAFQLDSVHRGVPVSIDYQVTAVEDDENDFMVYWDRDQAQLAASMVSGTVTWANNDANAARAAEERKKSEAVWAARAEAEAAKPPKVITPVFDRGGIPDSLRAEWMMGDEQTRDNALMQCTEILGPNETNPHAYRELQFKCVDLLEKQPADGP